MSTKTAKDARKQYRPLPPGWRWVRLRDLLVSIETGSRPKGGVAGITTGVPSLSAEHITRFGTFEFTSLRFVPRGFYNQMPRGHIQWDDILIVKDGATTGKAALIDDHFPFQEAVVNEHVFLCRPNVDIVSPRYLFLWLWGPEGQSAIRMNYRGSAIGGINQSFADSVLLPLPPLAEQRHIVAILSKQMAVVERARSAARAQREAAESLRSAYLRAVFSNPKARQWHRISIDGVSSLVTDGPHVTPSYVSSGVPFLTVRNVVNRRIDLSEVKYISEGDHARFARRGKAERGDILYTKDGTLGIPCVVETDLDFSFFVSVALIKLLQDRADPDFIAFALESPFVLKQVEQLGAGAGLKHIVLESIRALEVPLPRLAEQKRIAALLKAQLAEVRCIHQAVERQLEATNALPGALLREVFGGFEPPIDEE